MKKGESNFSRHYVKSNNSLNNSKRGYIQHINLIIPQGQLKSGKIYEKDEPNLNENNCYRNNN